MFYSFVELKKTDSWNNRKAAQIIKIKVIQLSALRI